MPPVRMLQAVAGADFSWIPGDVVPMSDEQAEVWADGVRGELYTEPVDHTVFDGAVGDAVRQALEQAEQQRQIDLDERQAQAVAIVEDNLVDPDTERAEELRQLAVDLVAGVEPVRAAELALLVALGSQVAPTITVPSTEEVSTVDAQQTGDAAAAEQRDAQPKPERAARKSRGGTGRAEPTPETRG